MRRSSARARSAARRRAESAPPLARQLAAHPFCRGFGARHLARLARHARVVKFAPGRVIFREGARAARLFLIASGLVALEIGKPGRAAIPLQTLGEGEALGFSWFFPPYRWYFSARALQPAEAIVLDAAQLRASARRDARFGYALAQRVGQLALHRLQATRLQLMDLYGGGG
jgi:CRP-like cAMP-binding protein